MAQQKLNVLHLVPATVSDFVRKDMEYLERYGPVKTSVMRIGWSGRRHIIASFLSLIRMMLRSLEVRRRRPDVVHAHFFLSALTASMCGIPAVVTIHDSHDSMSIYWRALFKIALRRCSIIFVSNYNRECWEPILNRKGNVIYHAIDMAEYSQKTDSQKTRESYLERLGTELFVVSMGAMTPIRGLHLVVQAAAEVRKRGIDVGVVLKGYGGDPQYTKRVEKLASRLGVPIIIVTSFIPDEEIASMIAAADVFVRPTSVESFGIAVLEAQACGTPVIVSDCCSLREVFHDSSLRFKLRDPPDLAERIIEVLSSENLSSKLVAAGLENARNLNWERKISSYVHVYRNAILGIKP
ncbi:MAG: glycosyltransferase [Candidatus Thorarchaeota archaeon]